MLHKKNIFFVLYSLKVLNIKGFVMKLFVVLFFSISSIFASGMISIKSQYSVAKTTQKLEKTFKKKGMNIFAIIPHSKGAKNIGVELRDTNLIIFGNPKIGSHLMKCQQTIALDLPQKVLVWMDEKNQTWITYNEPIYLKNRHEVKGCDKNFMKISKALKKLMETAIK